MQALQKRSAISRLTDFWFARWPEHGCNCIKGCRLDPRLDARQSTQPRASKCSCCHPRWRFLGQHSLFARNGDCRYRCRRTLAAKPEAAIALRGITQWMKRALLRSLKTLSPHRTLTLRHGDSVAGGASARWTWMSWLTRLSAARCSRMFGSGRTLSGGMTTTGGGQPPPVLPAAASRATQRTNRLGRRSRRDMRVICRPNGACLVRGARHQVACRAGLPWAEDQG